MSRLYACHRTFAVSTGMTALDVLLRLITPSHNVILAGDDIYGGTDRLLTFTKGMGGAEVVHLDLSDWGRARIEGEGEGEGQLAGVLKEHGEKVGMVLIESPTNPLLKIADIKAIADAVHAASPVSKTTINLQTAMFMHDKPMVSRSRYSLLISVRCSPFYFRQSALVVVDNTMMSPYLQRPIDLGADIIYDSGTKYLSGHHDVMAGIIAVDNEELAKVSTLRLSLG